MSNKKEASPGIDQIAAEAAIEIARKFVPVPTPIIHREDEVREITRIIKSAVYKACQPLLTAIKSAINDNEMMHLFAALDDVEASHPTASKQCPATPSSGQEKWTVGGQERWWFEETSDGDWSIGSGKAGFALVDSDFIAKVIVDAHNATLKSRKP